MQSRTLKKMKKKYKKAMHKGNLLVEMAEDMKDLIVNAKKLKK